MRHILEYIVAVVGIFVGYRRQRYKIHHPPEPDSGSGSARTRRQSMPVPAAMLTKDDLADMQDFFSDAGSRPEDYK